MISVSVSKPRQISVSMALGSVIPPYAFGKKASYPSSEVPVKRNTPLRATPTT